MAFYICQYSEFAEYDLFARCPYDSLTIKALHEIIHFSSRKNTHSADCFGKSGWRESLIEIILQKPSCLHLHYKANNTSTIVAQPLKKIGIPVQLLSTYLFKNEGKARCENIAVARM